MKNEETITISDDMKTMNELRTVLTEKPFFEVKWTVSNIRYYISLNDVIIKCNVTDAIEGAMSASMPVNSYMKDGENVLSVWMMPQREGTPIQPDQSITAELWVRSANPKVEGSYKIASVHCKGKETLYLDKEHLPKSERLSSSNEFLPAEDGDVLVQHQLAVPIEIYDEAYEMSVKMNVPNSLPRWAFFDSGDFSEIDDLTDEEFEEFERSLLAEYMKVHNALADGSEEAIDSVMPMFEERNRETEMALYMEPGRMHDLLRGDFVTAANKGKFELVNLRYESCDVRFEQNDRIVSLQRLGENPAIANNFREFSGCRYFDIYFRRQNGKWIICR